MNASPLWKQLESGRPALPIRLLRFVILAAGVSFLLFTGTVDLPWLQQAILGLLMVFLAIWMDRSSTSYLVTLTLLFLSCYSTFRYGYWRIATTFDYFVSPGNRWTSWDAFFVCLLACAEGYAFVILILGYVQTLWPLRRTPVPLPDDPDDWPAVDLLIPTYNEPLDVVRYTALAAMNIDWPADKLGIYILDDGKRDEFRQFAQEAGIGYMTRDDNTHAKAGNINRALKRLSAPFVTVFDCDHVPTRSFLQVTMGWFLRDPKLGMLQTPHHFYSPDPFERNLEQFRIIPNEGELFYGVVQDGNDFWNATFFCGSCAILRRSALDEIGGIAVETVTEDAHTSLRLQMNGWNTAYINIPQAAGLATESLGGHVKQRIRWARGMVQILRTDNPLFARGLKLAQRICYFNAMSHFLYALPRLIFLTAPLIYLILGRVNVPGYWAAILAYAFPHLVLSNITNSRIQGQHRHSFWNEIYETILSPYILLPTMLALFNPKLGSFDVTAKGGVVASRYFDGRLASPFLVMIGLNIVGLLMVIPRAVYIPFAPLSWWYDGNHPGTIVMNALWTVFNMVILGVCVAVAWESQQRRATVRVSMAVPADMMLSDGTVEPGVTADMSNGGVAIKIDETARVAVGESIQLIFPVLDGEATIPATVVGQREGVIRARFDPLTLQEEEALTMVLYSRADTWLGWGEAREVDRPLASLGRILSLSLSGFKQMFALALHMKSPPKRRFAAGLAQVLVLALLFGCRLREASAAQAPISGHGQATPSYSPVPIPVPSASTSRPKAGRRIPAVVRVSSIARAVGNGDIPAGKFDRVFKLSDVNILDTIELRGIDSFVTVRFSLPQTEVVKTATMHLKYHFSPGLLPALSHLKVRLNGSLFATLPVKTPPTIDAANPNPRLTVQDQQAVIVAHDQNSALLEANIAMPADMLVHDNQLTFEFVGHYTEQCEDPSNSTLWADVDNDSTIELAGALLPLQNNLKLLPLPFYDAAADLHPSLPIVFLAQPSQRALQAAGIVASWFGMLANDHPVRFPVNLGTIPPGNAIVIAENPADIPPALNLAAISGPVLAVRTNPVDPYSKLLVVSGSNGDELMKAASALALQMDMLESDQIRIPSIRMPAAREPDDAPRWMSTERVTHFSDVATTDQLQGGGFIPLDIYLRLPPDLYFGTQQNLPLHLGYRYNPVPLDNKSTLQVFLNNAYVSSTPLPHEDRATSSKETVLPVQRMNLRPFSNTFKMTFIFQIAKNDPCTDIVPMDLQGSIQKDSYLDIQDIPHWAVLPELELFANAGYPFTRKADLSDTTVVLPESPAPEEIEMFLTLMGHFGAQTGYPVLNVTVSSSAGMKADEKKDYIVLGTVQDQPAIRRLNPDLPVTIEDDGLHIQDTQGFFAPLLQHAWWKVRSSDHIQSGQLETSGGLPDALIEGIEWPSGSKRSVVVIALRDRSVVPTFLSVFLKTSQSSDISQSVSVLHGQRFASYRIGNDVYHVGYLSTYVRTKMLIAEYPWLVPISTILIALLMAFLVRAILRQHARTRLIGDE
jgi:cellulose synthase (UDP-forming)